MDMQQHKEKTHHTSAMLLSLVINKCIYNTVNDKLIFIFNYWKDEKKTREKKTNFSSLVYTNNDNKMFVVYNVYGVYNIHGLGMVVHYIQRVYKNNIKTLKTWDNLKIVPQVTYMGIKW